MANRGLKRITGQVFWSFLLPNFFSSLQFIKLKKEINALRFFLFTFVTINQQTAGLDRPNISVSWTGMKLGPNMYFVNKKLTNITFSEILSKIEMAGFEKIEIKRQLFAYFNKKCPTISQSFVKIRSKTKKIYL